ncbi:enkurin [Drosophila serrata]|uniref:enkurin n=1 Tax=Drosophila serrata TaxID=7274 RepID=UPI000A1D18DE|nr:enkurin [Drosophila serrata]KAH8373978.1 hypothetical protein KR200_006849 [Drosophila serrata]
MSLVYITHHDENILDCEQEFASGPKASIYNYKNPTVEKAAKYARKLRERLNDEDQKLSVILQSDGTRILTEAKKSLHRTMGYAHTPINPPNAFLRKNQGVKWRRENTHKCPKPIPMPPLPPAGSAGKVKIAPNFIKRNKEAAGKVTISPQPPRYIDTPVGTRHNLLSSGLVPQHISRKDFGKVPIYLKRTKKMLAEANAVCAKEQARLLELCRGIKGFTRTSLTMVDGPPEMPGMRVMDKPERNEILEGLRSSLTEMTKQYQSMSLLIDSQAKRLRKSKLETDLRQVEQDILLIETTPIIYVSEY